MSLSIFIFLVNCFLTPVQAQDQYSRAATQEEAGASSTLPQVETKQSDSIIADEKELIITGWHGTGVSYSGNVRLTSQSSGAVQILFLPSDLTRQEDGMTADRQSVTIDSEEIQLSPKNPKNIKIKITGIEQPGTYKGHVEFRPREAASGKILDLTLIAKPPQPLTPLPGTDQLKLHLTEGTLSNWLLPYSETIDERVLQFKNPFRLPVQLAAAEFVLNGEQTGYQLVRPTVRVEVSGNRQNDGIINFTLFLNRIAIPPDKYTGSVFVWLQGAKEALQIPVVEFTMRYGPLRAILLLLAGIVLGRFLFYMKVKGLALSKFTRYLDELKNRINHSEGLDRRILLYMFEQVESQVRNGKLKPEEVLAKLLKIEERRDLLLNVSEIEKALKDPKSADILSKIKAIRLAVRQEKDDDALRLFNELTTEIPSDQPSAIMALAIIQGPARPEAPPRAPLPVSRAENIKRFAKDIYSFLIKWVGPPIYYSIMLLFLLGAGLETLYMKNAPFGASPLIDYSTLVLWGLGSDVVSANVESVLTKAKLTAG
jgi:hypothetical protein